MTDNMLGGDATRPGDVLKIRNGKTIEVLNTDAEGRLILADALSLASEAKPDAMIDLATLTGACMVALGPKIAGLMGNNDSWIEQIEAASDLTGERVWHLPLPADYRKQVESSVADMKNIGGPHGGALTAGLILQEFVADGIPWAHLDIAGPAFTDSDDAEITKEAPASACGCSPNWPPTSPPRSALGRPRRAAVRSATAATKDRCAGGFSGCFGPVFGRDSMALPGPVDRLGCASARGPAINRADVRSRRSRRRIRSDSTARRRARERAGPAVTGCSRRCWCSAWRASGRRSIWLRLRERDDGGPRSSRRRRIGCPEPDRPLNRPGERAVASASVTDTDLGGDVCEIEMGHTTVFVERIGENSQHEGGRRAENPEPEPLYIARAGSWPSRSISESCQRSTWSVGCWTVEPDGDSASGLDMMLPVGAMMAGEAGHIS